MALTCGLAVLILTAVAAAAQPRFEVATLKPADVPVGDVSISVNLGRFLNGRLTMNNVTLADMMKYAYELASDAQLQVPDAALQQLRFDIDARTEPGTPPDELHKMMQALLVERMHLEIQREQRVLPHLALTVARDKARDEARDESKLREAEGPPPQQVKTQLPGNLDHPHMPMPVLARLLSLFEQQTVIDQTGLKGNYQVKLEWTPERMSARQDPNAAPPEKPSLFAAVQQQLGLKLESRRAPLEVLIVKSASRVPEEN